MVAEDGLSLVFVASGGVGETSSEGEVKGNRLEANIGVIVDLSDTSHYAIVKLLELESFGNRRQQKQGISDCIANKGFIHEFVGNDIRIAL